MFNFFSSLKINSVERPLLVWPTIDSSVSQWLIIRKTFPNHILKQYSCCCFLNTLLKVVHEHWRYKWKSPDENIIRTLFWYPTSYLPELEPNTSYHSVLNCYSSFSCLLLQMQPSTLLHSQPMDMDCGFLGKWCHPRFLQPQASSKTRGFSIPIYGPRLDASQAVQACYRIAGQQLSYKYLLWVNVSSFL